MLCLKGFDLTSEYPSMMLQNLPLRDRVVGRDMVYVDQLVKYAKTIEGTAEERIQMYIKGCDPNKRII